MALLTKVNVQLTSFIVAGKEIIIVTVLYMFLLRWSSPTRYMW